MKFRSSVLTTAAFTVHSSITELASKYDGFILDQFGVLHNGKQALAGATECVEFLATQQPQKQQNKKLIILSNTSASSRSTLGRLPKLGFPKEHFIPGGAVTSGEEASRHIAATYGTPPPLSVERNEHPRKKKAIWFTWEASSNPTSMAGFISQCGDIEIATSVEEADFVISHGSQVWRKQNMDDGEENLNAMSLGSFMSEGNFDVLDPILKECCYRNLPMICANPDFIAHLGDGSTGHMPGKIGERYEEMGGSCISFGKPHKSHFDACLRELGKVGVSKDRVVHVGDSLHHDIVGANSAGIASIFVTGGIHCKDVDLVDETGIPCRASLEALFEKEGNIVPTHVVPMFKL